MCGQLSQCPLQMLLWLAARTRCCSGVQMLLWRAWISKQGIACLTNQRTYLFSCSDMRKHSCMSHVPQPRCCCASHHTLTLQPLSFSPTGLAPTCQKWREVEEVGWCSCLSISVCASSSRTPGCSGVATACAMQRPPPPPSASPGGPPPPAAPTASAGLKKACGRVHCAMVCEQGKRFIGRRSAPWQQFAALVNEAGRDLLARSKNQTGLHSAVPHYSITGWIHWFVPVVCVDAMRFCRNSQGSCNGGSLP